MGLINPLHNQQMEQEAVAKGISLDTIYANNSNNNSSNMELDSDVDSMEPDNGDDWETICHCCVQTSEPNQNAPEDYMSEDNDLKEDKTQGEIFLA